jgi:hypothetical protein
MHFSFVTMLTTTKVIKAVSTVTSRSLRSVQSTGAASLFHTQAVRRGLSPQSVEECNYRPESAKIFLKIQILLATPLLSILRHD